MVDWYYKKRVGGRTVLHYCKYVGETVLYATENDTFMPSVTREARTRRRARRFWCRRRCVRPRVSEGCMTTGSIRSSLTGCFHRGLDLRVRLY